MDEARTAVSTSPKRVGKQLRSLRRKKGLSLSEVARGAGLTRRELVAYERGKVEIPESDLWVLAGACGVDVSELREPAGPPQLGAAPATIEGAIIQLRAGREDLTLARHLQTLAALRALPVGSRVQLEDGERASMIEVLGGDAATIERSLIQHLHVSPGEAAKLRDLILPTPVLAAPPEPVAEEHPWFSAAVENEAPPAPVDIFEELAQLADPAPAATQAPTPLVIDEARAQAAAIARIEQDPVSVTAPLVTDASFAVEALLVTDAPSPTVLPPPVAGVPDLGRFTAAPDFAATAAPGNGNGNGTAAPGIDDGGWVPSTDPTGDLDTAGLPGLVEMVEFVDDFVVEPAGDPTFEPPVVPAFDPPAAVATEPAVEPPPSGWGGSTGADHDDSRWMPPPAPAAPFGVSPPPSPFEPFGAPAPAARAAWAHEPDPAATSSGFVVDWGSPAAAPEPPAPADAGTDWALADAPAPAVDGGAGTDLEYQPISWRPLDVDVERTMPPGAPPGPPSAPVRSPVPPWAVPAPPREPAPAPAVSERPPPERFVTAGRAWEVGNAVPPVEVIGGGSLVMRRADERWALADVTTAPHFVVEADVDFRSGPGFGILFHASTDEAGRMSGFSFDVDPIHERGSYLVRQWHADRELWNPIARVPADDPSSMHGLLGIRIVVVDDTMTAAVNGRTVIRVESLKQACADHNREPATGDRVGIQAWSSSDLVVDTLRVAER